MNYISNYEKKKIIKQKNENNKAHGFKLENIVEVEILFYISISYYFHINLLLYSMVLMISNKYNMRLQII